MGQEEEKEFLIEFKDEAVVILNEVGEVVGEGVLGEQPDAVAVGAAIGQMREGLVSLQARMDEMRGAFHAQFSPLAEKAESAPWTKDIFDGYVIAEDAGQLYRVSYEETDDGVTFAPRAEWQEVALTYTPKGKELGEPVFRMAVAVAKAILGQKETLTTVWKDKDGQRYYMALVSMSIWDEEDQLVTKEGMDSSIAISRKYDYHSGVYIRHVVPEGLVGRSLYERRLGPYWIEVGKFLDGPLADRAYEILEKDEEDKWRLSIGFITTKDQEEEGRYIRLLKYDSTITDRPALPVTQVLAIGGRNSMEGIAKLLEFLNSDGEGRGEKDMAMLAEIFGVEEKELVAKVKEVKGLKEVKAAIAALEDDDTKKKLLAAIGTPGEEEDDDEGKKKKEKEKVLDPDVVQALKGLLAGEPSAKPVPELEPTSALTAEEFKAAVEEALAPLVQRVDALEQKPGVEQVVAEVKEIITAYKPSDPPKPSDTAPNVAGIQELIATLEKQLEGSTQGKHPLATFAGGPAVAEGG